MAKYPGGDKSGGTMHSVKISDFSPNAVRQALFIDFVSFRANQVKSKMKKPFTLPFNTFWPFNCFFFNFKFSKKWDESLLT